MRLQVVRLAEESEVDVSDADLIRFPEGMIGFESITEFALLADPEGGIQWLHSTGDDRVAFAVVDPFLIWPDYDITVGDADTEALGLSRPQDAQVLVVITPREDPSQISANLRAPIVINRATRVGRQVILAESTYAVRTEVLSALATAQAPLDADTDVEQGTDETSTERAAA